MRRVVSSEAFRDKKRDKKLGRVLNSDRNNNINNLEIVNLTPHEIPIEIQEF